MPLDHYKIELGKAEVLREGSDISIVAWGTQVHVVKETADIAEAELGVSVEVIDLGTRCATPSFSLIVRFKGQLLYSFDLNKVIKK